MFWVPHFSRLLREVGLLISILQETPRLPHPCAFFAQGWETGKPAARAFDLDVGLAFDLDVGLAFDLDVGLAFDSDLWKRKKPGRARPSVVPKATPRVEERRFSAAISREKRRTSPGGAADNSPGRKSWVSSEKKDRVPEGRHREGRASYPLLGFRLLFSYTSCSPRKLQERAMADQGFPLPGSSYRELIKIIQAYGKVPENAVPADVGRVISINETIVSSNNGFLKAVSIIQGGKKKTMTSAGKALAAAYEYDKQQEIAALWRSIIDATDFLQKVVAAVRIRKSMDETSLEAHVAYSAGQPKTPRVLTGAGTVVEILKTAGLLKKEGGSLVAMTPESPQSGEIVEQRLVLGDTMRPHADLSPSNLLFPPINRSASGAQLNIEVRIQCTPQDLDGLGKKLRRVLEEFNQPEPEETVAPAVPDTRIEESN